MFGETVDRIIETAFVWLISPGVGTYYGLKFTRKYFPDIEIKTLFIAITYIPVTYAVIMETFSVLLFIKNNPHSPSIIEMIVIIAQSASFSIGAKLSQTDHYS